MNYTLDPFDWYKQMHTSSPVTRLNQTLWHVFHYPGVQQGLSQPAFFSSSSFPPRPPDVAWKESLMLSDDPRHKQLRSLVSQAFTPRTVAQLTPRITAIANNLLDRVAESGQMDVIDDLAYPGFWPWYPYLPWSSPRAPGGKDRVWAYPLTPARDPFGHERAALSGSSDCVWGRHAPHSLSRGAIVMPTLQKNMRARNSHSRRKVNMHTFPQQMRNNTFWLLFILSFIILITSEIVLLLFAVVYGVLVALAILVVAILGGWPLLRSQQIARHIIREEQNKQLPLENSSFPTSMNESQWHTTGRAEDYHATLLPGATILLLVSLLLCSCSVPSSSGFGSNQSGSSASATVVTIAFTDEMVQLTQTTFVANRNYHFIFVNGGTHTHTCAFTYANLHAQQIDVQPVAQEPLPSTGSISAGGSKELDFRFDRWHPPGELAVTCRVGKAVPILVQQPSQISK